MKELNKLVLIAGAGRPPKPPTPHEPYDTPEGALFIGSFPKGKESLYSDEEIEMFGKLEGQYAGLPSTDPYQGSPPIDLEPEEFSHDPSARATFQGDYELGGSITTSDFNNFYAADVDARNSMVRDSHLVASKRAISVTEIKTLDLIGEGEIEGLSSGEYTFAPKPIGEIGYASASFRLNENISLNSKNYKYLQSIYYNQMPLVDQDGRFNFQQLDINFTPGLPNPGIGIEDITSEPLQVVRRIGERIRGPNTKTAAPEAERAPYYFSKFYKILNKSCDAIKLFIRLDGAYESINNPNARYEPVAAGKGSGDTIPIQLGFEVAFRRIFANRIPEFFSKPFRFNIVAKLTNGLIYEYRFPFFKTTQDLENPDFQGFEIKVTRLTPDSTVRSKNNRSTIDSLVEIYSEKFTYPNSAIVSSKFVAEFLTNIPKRTYDVKLLKVKIPDNYDPILKTYVGDWDGTFKDEKHWTDNPAWCYYDLLTNKRYGLGKYLKEEDIDKWSLYDLAKYCDEMVSDDIGGAEPRYVVNAYITERTEAFDALKNFSSIFRGLTYFMAGSIFCTYDSRKLPIYTFSNSNIKDGGFSYQGSSSQSRGNVFLVRYNDKNNFYEPAIEYLEDPLSIKRNGIIEKQISAFGCVKRSYALRYAEWMKFTENSETETVSFTAGLEGMLLKPGDVINIQDRSRSSRRLGGKIFDLTNSGAINVSSLTLDSKIPFSGGVDYTLSLITPTFNLDPSFITTGVTSGLRSSDIPDIRRPHIQNKTFTRNAVHYITGEDGQERTKIFFDSSFDETSYLISGRNVFSITCNNAIDANPPKRFRIINIKEESQTEYGISALEYNDEKYQLIDSGAPLSDESTTPPPAPVEIGLDLGAISLDNKMEIPKISYFITPPSDPKNIVGYIVYAKNGDWSPSDFTESSLSMTVSNKPPNNEYLIDNFLVPVSQKSQVTRARSFIPRENATYYFRAYSQNRRGLVSTTLASGKITTSNIQNTITYFSVNSLVPTDQIFFGQQSGLGNLYVSADQRDIDIPSGNVGVISASKKLSKGPSYADLYTSEVINLNKEPSLKWQFGIPLPYDTTESISIDDQGISFRVTAREPSPTSLPSKYIYFEITGHSAGAQALGGAKNENEITISFALNTGGIVRDSSSSRVNGKYPAVNSYKFPTTSQLIGPNKAFYTQFSGDYFEGNAGPFRNYDVVVEAVSKENDSSVGYSILGAEKIVGDRWSAKTSDLPNINRGYDIIEIRNPRPAQTICTPSFRLAQGKASIPNSDDADPRKKNSFFNIYNPQASQDVTYKVSDELSENYPTLPILGANNSEATFCVTDQYFNQEGVLSLIIKRDSRGFVNPVEMIDYRDAAVAIVYFSQEWFNSKNLKNLTWTESLDEEGLFASNQYEEKEPVTSKIIAGAMTLDSSNSSAYQTRILARIIDFQGNSPFIEDGQFNLNMDISNKKYVSFAFLDAIDVGASKIVDADNQAQVIINDSKNYNISPATLVKAKGEPNAKSGFRAYFKLILTYTNKTVNRSPTYAAHFAEMYLPAGGFYSTPPAWNTGVEIKDWLPVSFDAEIFSFGANETIIGIKITSTNFIFYFLLDEPTPIESRIYITNVNCEGGGKTEAEVSIIVPKVSFVTISDRNFEKGPLRVSTTAVVSNRLDLHPGETYRFVHSPDSADFTLYSNDQIQYKVISTLGIISNGQLDGSLEHRDL